MMNSKPRLTRSNDRWIAGVCGGIAEYLGWSPEAVRIGYVLLSIFSAGFPGILVYLILWIVMPAEARAERRFTARTPLE